MNTTTEETNNQKISAVIITFNEENNLADCLSSLDFVDEIIVVDSGSTDDTVKIAVGFGAKVINQEWLGFGKQKQFAVDSANNEWILSLDADERISQELKSSIKKAVNSNKLSVFKMPRRNIFMGKWLAHGEGYPDYNIRLFKKNSARWSQDEVHEHVVSNEEIGSLSGDILHYSEEGIEEYLRKQNRYTTIQAQQLFEKDKKVGFLKMATSPLFRFIKFYILRLGVLDGIPGLVHITIGCFNSYIKYAKLLEIQKRNHSSSKE